MKKEAKFNKIFWVGLVPLTIIFALVVMLVVGIAYASTKKKNQVLVNENIKEEAHVCAKADPEKIYVHDTVYLKSRCNKEHVVQTKTITPSTSDSPKDTGDSEK